MNLKPTALAPKQKSVKVTQEGGSKPASKPDSGGNNTAEGTPKVTSNTEEETLTVEEDRKGPEIVTERLDSSMSLASVTNSLFKAG